MSELIDKFNRRVRYLRMSVTDRCNLRCTYCMAEDMTFLPKAKVLSLEEIAFIGRAFVELGVEKIRLTGGEPLVRKGLIDLAQQLGQLSGLKKLAITSNGVLLDQYAKPLVDAGVQALNISIDSLQADRFKRLTRFGELDDVLRGIQAAKVAGFKRIKLNAVVLKDINDDEVISLAQYAIDQGLDISFIEEMPLGEVSSHLRSNTQVSSLSIKQQLAEIFQLHADTVEDPSSGPSRYFRVSESDTRIGFISPMSDNFCASCNRVRLTVEGRLLLCLGNEHSLDLKAIVRDKPKDIDAVKEAIVAAMDIKPERHYFDPNDITITRHMSVTGG